MSGMLLGARDQRRLCCKDLPLAAFPQWSRGAPAAAAIPSEFRVDSVRTDRARSGIVAGLAPRIRVSRRVAELCASSHKTARRNG